MEICLGTMGMRPKDFWNLSPIEMYSAIRGLKEFHTADTQQPMSKNELEELMELYPD